jgi:hypothetical protein
MLAILRGALDRAAGMQNAPPVMKECIPTLPWFYLCNESAYLPRALRLETACLLNPVFDLSLLLGSSKPVGRARQLRTLGEAKPDHSANTRGPASAPFGERWLNFGICLLPPFSLAVLMASAT